MTERDPVLRSACLRKANNECANCGQTATQAHHVVPLVLGGFDKLSNLVALCEVCHEKVHGTKLRNHSELTKEGLKKAQERGVKLGGARPHLAGLNDAKKQRFREEAEALGPLIESLRCQGMSLRKISTYLNTSGMKNAHGRNFNAVHVSHLLKAFNEFTASGPG